MPQPQDKASKTSQEENPPLALASHSTILQRPAADKGNLKVTQEEQKHLS